MKTLKELFEHEINGFVLGEKSIADKAAKKQLEFMWADVEAFFKTKMEEARNDFEWRSNKIVECKNCFGDLKTCPEHISTNRIWTEKCAIINFIKEEILGRI